jgi:hypothetical protein
MPSTPHLGQPPVDPPDPIGVIEADPYQVSDSSRYCVRGGGWLFKGGGWRRTPTPEFGLYKRFFCLWVGEVGVVQQLDGLEKEQSRREG